MIEYTRMISTENWLETKLISGDDGIIFDNCNRNSFEEIQEFIASKDCQFQTPIIYYQAFPEESSIQFLDTLQNELTSKLGTLRASSPKSLSTTIEDAGLKMIVIDDCHLHPEDTLQNLLDFFSSCNVAVILVGCKQKMTISQILNNPIVRQWEQFQAADECKTTRQ